jgi:hypothetical protein
VVSAGKHPVSEGLVTVSNGLTRRDFVASIRVAQGRGRRPAPHIRLCSRMQTGYQGAIKRILLYAGHFLIAKGLPTFP